MIFSVIHWFLSNSKAWWLLNWCVVFSWLGVWFYSTCFLSSFFLCCQIWSLSSCVKLLSCWLDGHLESLAEILVGLLFLGHSKDLKSDLRTLVIIRPHKVSFTSIRRPFLISITELQKHFEGRNVQRADINKRRSRVGRKSARCVCFLWKVAFKVCPILMESLLLSKLLSLLYNWIWGASVLSHFWAQQWKNAKLVQHTC